VLNVGQNIEESQFVWLRTNIEFANCVVPNDRLRERLKRDALVTVGGINIGVFGMTTAMTEPVLSSDRYVPIARQYSALLRNNRKADVVIALTHLDKAQDRDILLLGKEGPDVIVGGHDHEKMAEPRLYKADADARTASVITITVSDDSGVVIQHEFRELNKPPDAAVNEVVNAWLEKHEQEFCRKEALPEHCLRKPLATIKERALVGEESKIRGTETSLGNWVTNIMRERCQAQVAFINSGSLRLNHDLEAGSQIRRRHIEELFEYPTKLRFIQITGAQLQEVVTHGVQQWPGSGRWLQVSGLAFRHTPDKVSDLTLLEDGKPPRSIGKDETLRAVTSHFLRDESGDGYAMLKSAKSIAECQAYEQEDLKDIVLKKLETEGQLEPYAAEGRICQEGSTCLAVASTAPVSSQTAAVAEPSSFVLFEMASANQKELSLTVPHNGKQFDLHFVTTKPSQALVDLKLGTFYSEQGDVLPVTLGLPDGNTKRDAQEQKDIRVNGGLLPFRVVVPPLPTDRKYTGMLMLQEHGKEALFVKILLSRPSPTVPPTLVVDRPAQTLTVTQKEAPIITITLRDKHKREPLRGITARLEQVTKAPPGGFDLKNNVDFLFNSRAVKDFTIWPPLMKNGQPLATEERSIPEGGQAEVQMKLKNLRAGEYLATLRFQAANSADDENQKLALTLHVRHSLWWAVVALAGALLFSYVSTKGVNFRWQRLALHKRIDDLNASWLRQEPPILPVVWALAMLRQAKDLSNRFWLASPDTIDARVTAVSALVGELDRVRQLRQDLGQTDWHPFVTVRAKAVLSRAVASLGSGPLDTQKSSQLQSTVTSLKIWFQNDQLKELYWKDVSATIQSLLAQVRPELVDEAARARIRALVDVLKSAAPSELDQMIIRECAYAHLKILWERRAAAEFLQLINFAYDQEPIEVLFQRADNAAWNRLKRQQEEGKLRIISPRADEIEPCNAYDPLLFRLDTGDRALNETFLVKHGLQYEWTFTLNRKEKWTLIRNRKAATSTPTPASTDNGKAATSTLTPISTEPQVVQYAPWQGTITPSVTIRYNGETVQVGGAPLDIGKSREFRWQEGFETTEILAFVVAALTAIATGLYAFYSNNDFFGSFKDYLFLVGWGIGVDQTKNFVQILQTYSTWPVKPKQPA